MKVIFNSICKNMILISSMMLYGCSSLSQLQEMKNNLNTALIANVETNYEETPDDNPCAGSEVYLTLLFDKEEVLVTEKEISSCDKESIYHIGTFNWKLLDKKEINIDFNTEKIKGTYAENLSLQLRGEKIIGKIKHLNGKVVEYIFKKTE